MSKKLKFGVIGVFGRPNAGKSTLINSLVGEDVSIVSCRPQTTRRRILGILTKDSKQIVFCDTPGLHPVKNKLDAFMDDEIHSTMAGLHGFLYLVDASSFNIEYDKAYLEDLKSGYRGELNLVINKIDLVPDEQVVEIEKAYSSIVEFKNIFRIPTKKKKRLLKILNYIGKIIPEGPHAYHADFYTSLNEREIVEEVIRQVILERFHHEVPHSAAVQVEQFKERDGGKTFVEANIYIEKEGHKKILVGANGAGIKKIGQESRERLNRLLGRDIFLQLWIKVKQNWRKKDEWVRNLGYKKK